MFSSIIKAKSIMGIKGEFNEEQLKKIWREKSKKLHPDVGGSNEEFCKLSGSYEILKKFLSCKEAGKNSCEMLGIDEF